MLVTDSRAPHPHVVITGSVNSSELTLFDPVIHVDSRPAPSESRLRPTEGRIAVCPPAGEASPVGPAMTQFN